MKTDCAPVVSVVSDRPPNRVAGRAADSLPSGRALSANEPWSALADLNQRAACPRCQATATRADVPGAGGRRRIEARCSALDCDWDRVLEIDESGRAVPVVERGQRLFPSLPPPPRASDPDASPCVPPCLVSGCEGIVAEGMLCRGHLALWRAAGAPPDIEAWARAYAKERDTSGALRIVPVRFRPRQKVERLLTLEEFERLWASVPDVAFEP